MWLKILVLSFYLVADLPGLVGWERRTISIYRIDILYHIVISHYHIMVKLLQNKVMAPPV